jgi:hypothetical protein
MTGLLIVFLIKILFTAIFWSLPLLFAPEKLVLWIGIPITNNMIFLRLLGMVYTSLLVGYIFAFNSIRQGEYPLTTVWVGIVSNGGAALILLVYGLFGYWKSWKIIAQAGMWFFMFATALISIGLIATGLYPQHF